MTQHLSAITLLVGAFDAGLAFYIDKLGFDLLEDTKLSETKRWVRVAPPGGQTALLLTEPKNDRERAALGNQTGGRVGFFLQTDHFDRDYAAMLAKGVEFKEAPRFEPYGSVAVFTDPWGNLWDLIEPKTER